MIEFSTVVLRVVFLANVMVLLVASPTIASEVGTGGGQCVANYTVDTNQPLAVFKTASGTWRVAEQDDGWLWTLDENPGWSSVMACNSTDEFSKAFVSGRELHLSPHACRFAQDEPPVSIDPQRLRSAIAENRWVPYRASRVEAWPLSFGAPAWQPGSLEKLDASIYDPASLNGISASDNLVGIISTQGGEYTTSRGPIDDADARVLALALDERDDETRSYTQALYNAAFASAGFPHRTPFAGSMLRDPQKPPQGLQYEYRHGGSEVRADVDSFIPELGWKYDSAHLANSGWALWMGTEDPRIGIIVQSHAAFALATYFEYQRSADIGSDGRLQNYRCAAGQERGVYNCLNAMWRARDVARHTNSNDVMLWSVNRVDEMYRETTEQVDEIVASITGTDTNSTSLSRALEISSSSLANAYCTAFGLQDGSTMQLGGRSNFMDQQYGGVPTYLRARAGELLGLKIMDRQARHMIARTLYIGGSLGVDGLRDLRGSTIPITTCERDANGYLVAMPPPYSTLKGWAAWAISLDSHTAEGTVPARDKLDNAAGHTALQTDFILRAAQSLVRDGMMAPIEDLDAAILALDAARNATTPGSVRFGAWYKHVADFE